MPEAYGAAGGTAVVEDLGYMLAPDCQIDAYGSDYHQQSALTIGTRAASTVRYVIRGRPLRRRSDATIVLHLPVGAAGPG